MKNINGYVVSFALAASVLAAPIAASAQEAGDMVSVAGCAVSDALGPQTFMGVDGREVYQPGTPAMLMIDFKNSASKPIKAIDFGYLQHGKVLAVVRDVGSFTPGASIMHAFSFHDMAMFSHVTSMSCVPLRIRYADGTEWKAPK